MSTNVESDGRFHSNWLNMMYPRLKLARNLLKDDGVIFISIDDNEVDNLKKICNDIFGEQNFQSCVSWRRRSNQPNDDSKMIAKVKEYILVYSKSYEVLKKLKSFGKVPLSDKRLSTYTNPDNDPKGEWSTTPWCASRGQGGSKYEIVTPTGKSYNETWLGTKETFKNLLEEERIVFTNNGDGKPRKKVYKRDAIKKGQSAIDFWQGKMFGDNLSATADLKKIFKLNRIFDYSKPVNLLNIILRLSCPFIDGLVLDFFSGSATMAEAVLKYNSTMQKKLNYVMIQLDEKIPKSSEAYNAGYGNICEIGKERIRRAGDMIVGESGNSDLDIGFKVFKLDSSNLEKWDPDFDNLEQTLLSFQDNVKSDRCDLDLVYEVMLKYGLDLTLSVEKIELSNNLVYSVGFGALLICLDDNVTSGIANEIVDLQKDSEVIRVVFKDNGFASDSDKTNIKETLRTNGIEEFITI
ncbi:site-specific DNA-methyltransferase [Methanobrevibacter boviskoreani]|uniref:site-specific DNA-methyltransferase n=1 Tax=Methanobrevibacter boviskoreani TaxID=1348249 RepID=UPI0005946372|nr:site-specific DNA-methyltransferase [Methanobrevibacter boviskoreani]